jgi:hypothetical protein
LLLHPSDITLAAQEDLLFLNLSRLLLTFSLILLNLSPSFSINPTLYHALFDTCTCTHTYYPCRLKLCSPSLKSNVFCRPTLVLIMCEEPIITIINNCMGSHVYVQNTVTLIINNRHDQNMVINTNHTLSALSRSDVSLTVLSMCCARLSKEREDAAAWTKQHSRWCAWLSSRSTSKSRNPISRKHRYKSCRSRRRLGMTEVLSAVVRLRRPLCRCSAHDRAIFCVLLRLQLAVLGPTLVRG